MDINVVSEIPFPISNVFKAMRDHMPELAEYMPNVDNIDVESREESPDGRVHLVNRWNAAATEIPAVARPFVDQSDVYWLDHAVWDENTHACQWLHGKLCRLCALFTYLYESGGHCCSGVSLHA